MPPQSQLPHGSIITFFIGLMHPFPLLILGAIVANPYIYIRFNLAVVFFLHFVDLSLKVFVNGMRRGVKEKFLEELLDYVV